MLSSGREMATTLVVTCARSGQSSCSMDEELTWPPQPRSDWQLKAGGRAVFGFGFGLAAAKLPTVQQVVLYS